jgi:hypothetical protein
MKKENSKKIALWMLAAFASAIIGGIIKTAYDSASPEVEVITVKPSLEINEHFVNAKTEVDTPQQLRQLVEKSFWTSALALRRPRVKYSNLIENLEDNEERMREHLRSGARLRAALSRLKKIARLGAGASPEEREEFYDLWEINDGIIYGSLRGHFNRGLIQLENKIYEGEPCFQINERRDGNYVVSKKGGRFSTSMSTKRERETLFQREVSQAVAYLDSELLLKYLELLKKDLDDENVAGQILEEIETVRYLLSRWAVTVAVSNSGSKSIAFLPYAKLEVKTKGLTRDGKEVAEFLTLPLEARIEGPEPTPIQMNGGSSELISFASKDFIIAIPQNEILQDAFKIGACTCRVTLLAKGGGVFTTSTYSSNWSKFAKTEVRLD